jgi:cyclopropane fatty-acyl-phospholipid synthase-like methyltransferase
METLMNTPHNFPDWEQLYQDQEVESMPWFHPDLDPDLEKALAKLDLHQGTALDLGTGPGTQALALTERGFQVAATDLSLTAIQKAQRKAQDKGLNIAFFQDDILHSNLDQKFDFILDRGCFHVLPPERRQEYVQVVNNLLNAGGYLFLKCFSVLETREKGPYRFTPEQIHAIFAPLFKVHSVEESVYFGTLDPLPRALFCILEKS